MVTVLWTSFSMYQISKTDCQKLVKLLGLISSQHTEKWNFGMMWMPKKDISSLKTGYLLFCLFLEKKQNKKKKKKHKQTKKTLQARYYGPYTVGKKISDINYIVNTPGRRKQKQLCHVNMLKQYIDRDSFSVTPISVVSSVPQEYSKMDSKEMIKSDSDIKTPEFWLSKGPRPDTFIPRSRPKKWAEAVLQTYALIFRYSYKDWQNLSRCGCWGFTTYKTTSIYDEPYKTKKKCLNEEIQYLLDNDFIEPSQSEWSSPCILVPKSEGTYRICTDYRKVFFFFFFFFFFE